MSPATPTLQSRVNRLELVGMPIALNCGNDPLCAVRIPGICDRRS